MRLGIPNALGRTPFRKSHGKITLVLYNKHHWCGGKCLYCFVAEGFTRSTTRNEDTLLARDCDWDPVCQLGERFKRYGLVRGRGYKYDLAVKGDTFTTHPKEYLADFVRACHDFFNGGESSSLEESGRRQASAPDRCVTFKVETRPDCIDDEWCQFLMDLGVTTVEIGVQSLDDDVLEINRRGHGVEASALATRLLKQYGFEVVYQIMVGLPGSTPEKDRDLLAHQLWDEPFCPDAVKLYPCVLLRESVARHLGLADMVNTAHWTPMTTEEYIRLLQETYPRMPRYVHVNRIQRIFAPSKVAAGPADVIDRTMFDGLSRCLWQRSVAQKHHDLDADFSGYRVESYQQGHGYCFEAVVDEDTAIGYGRLSIPADGDAIVRDVRTLGNMLPVGAQNTERIGTQHIGVGKALMRAMEATAESVGARRVRLRPAVGVRSYFERLGYSVTDGRYVEKRFGAQSP
jgi:elongator complex protein 3